MAHLNKPTMIKRSDMLLLLKPFFEKVDGVLAVWEAGSQATGRVDAYSDLDLLVLCQHEHVEDVLMKTKSFLEAQIPNGIYRRAPEPTWHGFSQFFYLPKDEPYFYFDFSFTSIQNPNKFTEIERHGTPTIWFEKVPIYQPRQLSQEDQQKLAIKTIQGARFYEPIIAKEVIKACKRGLDIDARTMYFTYLQRFLVPFINVKYRPHKADFGVRYLINDVPKDVYKILVRFFQVHTLSNIEKTFTEVQAMVDQLNQELSAVYEAEKA